MRLIFLPFACLLIAGFTHAQTNTNLGTNSGNGGRDNTSIGYQAGNVVTGNMNSFLGSLAGKVNTSGASNSFFGYAAGYLNTSGSNNSFFGRASPRFPDWILELEISKFQLGTANFHGIS